MLRTSIIRDNAIAINKKVSGWQEEAGVLNEIGKPGKKEREPPKLIRRAGNNTHTTATRNVHSEFVSICTRVLPDHHRVLIRSELCVCLTASYRGSFYCSQSHALEQLMQCRSGPLGDCGRQYRLRALHPSNPDRRGNPSSPTYLPSTNIVTSTPSLISNYFTSCICSIHTVQLDIRLAET